jgi:hypothetical protein
MVGATVSDVTALAFVRVRIYPALAAVQGGTATFLLTNHSGLGAQLPLKKPRAVERCPRLWKGQ